MTAVSVVSAEAMEALGRRVGARLAASDVVVLHGALGAGKTTFTRGVGQALAVHGTIASPTFVVARTHPSSVAERAPLVHVDAYRLANAQELVDLDIDYDHSIVLIEWGRAYVEKVADQWLDIDIETRASLYEDDQPIADDRERLVTLSVHSPNGKPPQRLSSLLEGLHDFGH
ncbi:MAG: tRNA (adenosine(37)-N6)-threonylcarbamoyltransferase complex ATPase subunit type 1 TsaE [Pontimonas sp.]